MVTDRWQHELWHICDLTQRAAPGRARELAAQWSRLMHFWWTRDWGIGTTEAGLPRVWFW